MLEPALGDERLLESIVQLRQRANRGVVHRDLLTAVLVLSTNRFRWHPRGEPLIPRQSHNEKRVDVLCLGSDLMTVEQIEGREICLQVVRDVLKCASSAVLE